MSRSMADLALEVSPLASLRQSTQGSENLMRERENNDMGAPSLLPDNKLNSNPAVHEINMFN